MADQNGKASEYVGKILSEKRKAKKPLMEKMRRARINDSLNELKFLVLDALNKDVSRYSKMEKADVLEMAVQHLRELKRMEKKQRDAVAEYRAGFSKCAVEVSRTILPCVEGADQLRLNILSHLASACYQGNLDKSAATTPVSLPRTNTIPALTASSVAWLPYPSPPPSPVEFSAPVSSTIHTANTVPATTGYKLEQEPKRAPQNTPVPLWRPW